MSKYFVEDLPRSCFYCDCCHTKIYDNRYKIDGEHFCGIMDINVDGDYYDYNDGICCRPDWCPLRKIPNEHKELNAEEYEFGNLGLAFTNGWNACIREMLKE